MASSCNQLTLNDFNRYIADDPADHIEAEEFNKILYKVGAIASMILFVAVVIGGLVPLCFFAPAGALFYLPVAAALYKPFKDKVYKPLMQKSLFASQDAQTYKGMAEEIQKVKKTYSGYTAYHNALKALGINACEIPISEYERAGGKFDLKPLAANLMGRVHYWNKVVDSTLQKIASLDHQIAEIADSPDPKKMAQKKRLRRQKQQLEEVVLLPAKVAAAYALHVLSDVKDTRNFDAFGTCQPASYESHLEYMADKVPQPYYVFPEGSSKSPLSKEKMLTLTPLALSKQIFGNNPAFA